jgi:energy-coupling factor transporter ATP-binding protein EcfA2
MVIDVDPSKIDATRRGHAVSIEHISHAFGDSVALDDVTLDIKPGELVALLGPSGCGKTTLVRAIAGFVDPSRGNVRFDNESVLALSAGRQAFRSHADGRTQGCPWACRSSPLCIRMPASLRSHGISNAPSGSPTAGPPNGCCADYGAPRDHSVVRAGSQSAACAEDPPAAGHYPLASR